MEFDQLIEYNMRYIFLEKSYTKYGGETIPRPFSKNWKLSISLDQLTILDFTSYKAFLKKKTGISLLASFSPWFFMKNSHLIIFY